nr:hypothetical protein [Nonomuraea ceibae]
MRVEVVPVCGIRGLEDLRHLGQSWDQPHDLLLTVDGPQASFRFEPLGPGLGHPPADLLGISARVQRRPIAGHPTVAVVDGPLGRLDRDPVGLAVSRLQQGLDRSPEVYGREDLAQPGVQLAKDVVLADVDRTRVLDLVGQGVLGGKLAPVVRAAVVPRGFHPAGTDTAVQQAAQDVRSRTATGLALDGGAAFRRQQLLHTLERLRVHDRLVRGLLRPDPLALGIPLELGDVALGDVLDVQELFLLALLVPDLTTGVAGVQPDGLDG